MIENDYTIYLHRLADGVAGDERLLQTARRHLGEAAVLGAIARKPGGKPYFAEMPRCCFSISHSSDYWVCAMGRAEVGLDLQYHKNSDFQALARRFFHPEEYDFLVKVDFTPASFYGIWCAKESYIKFTGLGLAQDLASFSVVGTALPVTFRRLPCPPGYSLCLCAETIGRITIIPPPSHPPVSSASAGS